MKTEQSNQDILKRAKDKLNTLRTWQDEGVEYVDIPDIWKATIWERDSDIPVPVTPLRTYIREAEAEVQRCRSLADPLQVAPDC